MANRIRKGNETSKKEFSMEVIEKCGILSKNGTTILELRYVAWNGAEPKYDIRPWYIKDGEEKAGKGVTLTGEELEALGQIIKEMMESED